MLRYIFKRLLQLIPMLLILSLIVFFMVRMIPGDPVKNMLGIDVPQEMVEVRSRTCWALTCPRRWWKWSGSALA